MLSNNKGFMEFFKNNSYWNRVLVFFEEHPTWKVGSKSWFYYLLSLEDEYDENEWHGSFVKYYYNGPSEDEYGKIDQYQFDIPDDVNTLSPKSLAYLALIQRMYLIRKGYDSIAPYDIIKWPFDGNTYPDPICVNNKYYAYYDPFGMYAETPKLKLKYKDFINNEQARYYLEYLLGLFTGYDNENHSTSKKRVFNYPIAQWDFKDKFHPAFPIESVQHNKIGDDFKNLLNRLKYTINNG